MPELVGVDAEEIVWRVGFRPDPWAWSDWSWAVDGRFDGRWDDSAGNFRTVYASSSLLGCFLEVLACFRPDPVLAVELAQIDEDDQDAEGYSTAGAGTVPHDWAENRRIGTAILRGRFCDITSVESIALLRPRFISMTLSRGLRDFDAAALKDSRPRSLTQAVATYVHTNTDLHGVAP